MKYILIITLVILSFACFGQDKYNHGHFNKLTEVKGTEYVIASFENWGKTFESKSSYLLFINTKTNETKQLNFPNGSDIFKIQQIKIDSLQINLIVVEARTMNLYGKSEIDWNDPTQLIVISTDGNEKNQLTENNFFVRTWSINRLIGTIVVTGHFDTNNNDKFDNKDKSNIFIYDLKTLKLLSKI